LFLWRELNTAFCSHSDPNLSWHNLTHDHKPRLSSWFLPCIVFNLFCRYGDNNFSLCPMLSRFQWTHLVGCLVWYVSMILERHIAWTAYGNVFSLCKVNWTFPFSSSFQNRNVFKEYHRYVDKREYLRHIVYSLAFLLMNSPSKEPTIECSNLENMCLSSLWWIFFSPYWTVHEWWMIF
jgi:hypothetical protein